MSPLSSEGKKISDIVIPRILTYLRVIQQCEKDNKETISSEEIAQRTDISAFQVRKDLANFGRFGQVGTGYNVADLNRYLLNVIGGKEMCNLALVGVGNLGSALLNYKGFEKEGLQFVAAFDSDTRKVGKVCGSVLVEHIDNMKESAKRNRVHIGIIAVLTSSAQSVADQLIEAGIYSILNFAPAVIAVPKEVTLRNVDLSIELKALRYFSLNR